MSPRRALVLGIALANAGCASLWGFDDLTVGDAGSVDATPDMMMPGDSAPTDTGMVAPEAAPDACTPIAHSNGVGETYESCEPLGTYTLTTALQACLAYAQAIGDTAFNCFGPWTFCGVAEGTNMVCHGSSDEAGTAGLTCETYCWAYSGSHVGLVTGCGCTGIGAWQ